VLDIREHNKGITFPVNVQPRSKKNGIAEIRDGVLIIKVNAPPVEGAANKALKKLLSQTLGISKSNIEILKGKTSHRKLILCRNFRIKDLEQALKRLFSCR